MINALLFAAIAGVLIASSEYGGGQLTTTVLAVPRRGRTLSAKLVLSAIIATGQGLILATFIATIHQVPLGDQSVYATGTASTLLGSLALAVCSWTVIGILSTCIAFIICSQPVALASMIVLTFGGTPLMMALPIFQYLPTNAGVLMFIDRRNQTSARHHRARRRSNPHGVVHRGDHRRHRRAAPTRHRGTTGPTHIGARGELLGIALRTRLADKFQSRAG